MKEVFDLVNQMSPYLLLGFLLAGIMHAFVPHKMYKNYLSKSNFRSVFNATLLGIPLPLCSCGVIPTAMSLRKEGASKGATVAFLIATPQTGVDSIIATFSLLGLPFALIRPFAALVTALFGGTMVNLFLEKDFTDTAIQRNNEVKTKEILSLGRKIVSALRYAFVDMMQDIGKWLILGLVVAGLITVFVPESFFALFADNSLLSMLVVLLFAIPMYLCATGSIPIAVALMIKGLSPGTALVLLMAGPAINFASILVVGKVLGRKTLFIYLASIIMGSMLLGLGIDYLLPREWFTSTIAQIHSCNHHSIDIFNIICTVVMFLLLINAFILKYRKKDKYCCHSCTTEQSNPLMVVYIDGMHCNNCKNTIEKNILQLEGVESVEIDLQSGKAVIHGTVSFEPVAKTIKALGFEVREP